MVAADSLAVAGCTLGAGYGAAASGSAISAFMSIPIAMFGLIMSVIIIGAIPAGQTGYCAKVGFAHFGSGMSVGLSGLSAGTAIGIVGDAGVRATAQQPKLFVGMILILIFAEALGLYGLIVALVMSGANCSA